MIGKEIKQAVCIGILYGYLNVRKMIGFLPFAAVEVMLVVAVCILLSFVSSKSADDNLLEKYGRRQKKSWSMVHACKTAGVAVLVMVPVLVVEYWILMVIHV